MSVCGGVLLILQKEDQRDGRNVKKKCLWVYLCKSEMLRRIDVDLIEDRKKESGFVQLVAGANYVLH